MSKKVLDTLVDQLGEAIVETTSAHGDDTAVVDPLRWKDVALFLRDSPRTRMDHFIDLTVVDYRGWTGPARPAARYEVVLHVRSIDKLHRIRLEARLAEPQDGAPSIDSLADVWPGANWFEREAYDMFGVRFGGHPDLRRILMYEQFDGHPLRKDYDAKQAQPLVDYRPEAVDHLPPFDAHEGMPFGRRTHDHRPGERNLLDELPPPADAAPPSGDE